MTRGVVVGKFYPPHLGHLHLIEAALAEVGHLDVIVCSKADQWIPGEFRAAWLRELAPAATVIHAEDLGRGEDSAFWARYTRNIIGGSPDVVFTSEPYGDAYAKALGCRHVEVDLGRKGHPVSGTAIRQSPTAYWDYLPASVRAWFVRRVVVAGAESTGTTTLAQALATHYKTECVPEYGRAYSEVKFGDGDVEWLSGEFVTIARMQLALEDKAARSSSPLLICDTDALATSIWHERYVGGRNEDIERVASSRRYAAYILTSNDIAFVQDGYRDGEHLRDWMTRRFREELSKRSEPWIEVRGSGEERLAAAVAHIDGLPSNWRRPTD